MNDVGGTGFDFVDFAREAAIDLPGHCGCRVVWAGDPDSSRPDVDVLARDLVCATFFLRAGARGFSFTSRMSLSLR